MSPILQTINLSKHYNDTVIAVNNLNLTVNSGEIYALLGGNGAGKTTTMNLFLNFVEPTSGSAMINGIESHKEPLNAKKFVAYVSENVQLYGQFTAIQNLDFLAVKLPIHLKIMKMFYFELDFKKKLIIAN